MLNGKDEWLWRPVANRETLQLSAFVDANPKGFGFLQRDREFGNLRGLSAESDRPTARDRRTRQLPVAPGSARDRGHRDGAAGPGEGRLTPVWELLADRIQTA